MYICLYITAEILSPPSWNWFKQLTAISTKKKKFFRICSMLHFPEHKFIVEEIMLRLLEF